MTRLSEIVGQEAAIGALRHAAAIRRLPHALLFAGPEGVGKRTTGVAFAAWLLCPNTKEDSCGKCAACVQIEAGSYPDLSIEARHEDSRDLSIDQVREIQSVLGRRPIAGPRRIAIVDGADSMSEPAQNAFLKTLEEPPGDSLVILIAHNAAALLPTVRSRCQRITFAPLPAALLRRVLEGRMPGGSLRLVSAYADGSLGRALSVDRQKLDTAVSSILALLDEVSSGAPGGVARGAETLLELERAGGGLDLLLQVLRERLRIAAGIETPEESRFGEPAGASGSDLLRALGAAEAAYQAAGDLHRNANKGLAVERMLLRLAGAPSNR